MKNAIKYVSTGKDGVLSRSIELCTYTWPLASSSIENNPYSGNSSTPGPLIEYFMDVFWDALLKSYKQNRLEILGKIPKYS